MFSSTSTSSADISSYDFEENAHKWRKVFVSSLQKMVMSMHPKLTAREDALEYLESLVVQLLCKLCSPPAPHTVQDVEEKVMRLFPTPINQYAVDDAQAAVEKKKKKGSLILPTDRVHPLLKDALQSKIDIQVTVYTLAILEYVSSEILKLVACYVRDIELAEVTQHDIRTAIFADQKLVDFLMHSPSGEPTNSVVEEAPIKESVTLTYDQLVKDLIEHEKSYIRELSMIVKVFRDEFRDKHVDESVLSNIFFNIDDIYDFSVNLLGSIEDTIEVTKEDEVPAIGSCFEEMAEGAEFDVYLRYCTEVVDTDSYQTALGKLMQHPNVRNNISEMFRDAVLYALPRLMHVPLLHVYTYRMYIEELKACAQECDMCNVVESLEQVQGLLCPLYSQLDRIIQAPDAPQHLKRRLLTEPSIRANSQFRRQSALQKLNEIQRSIEGWEGKDLSQSCNNLIFEGDLKMGYPSTKKVSDRHVFLFDGLIVLCKQKVGGHRFKERYTIKNVDIVDREDSDDLMHSFEIACHDGSGGALLFARTAQEKLNWMAALVSLSSRSFLERALDSILMKEEQQNPLHRPDPSIYPFSEPDSDQNIDIEQRPNSSTPLIKGATLTKLIERLTYHTYADPTFVRTFLTTYRSFCTPTELLEMLKKRFAIPEPDFCKSVSIVAESQNGDCVGNPDPTQDAAVALKHRGKLKRFRKEYVQPVQFRVLNVLRHWVDYHFYDFDRDSELLDNLVQFLESVQTKSMRKWVESITKIIQRKSNEEVREITFSQNRTPPSPKHHMRMEDKDWEEDVIKPLFMLHPVEIARQLTLLEFDLYKKVKPSELMNNAWTKDDKMQRSPNLLKMIHHSNVVSWWVRRCIIECENFEERVAAMTRVIEVMIMFYDLNNFCGLFELSSAFESASVHRLELTKAEVKRRLPPAQKAVYEEAMELGQNHHKKYLEKLRSINPPCVPFVGIYLTNIIHIESGNPDNHPHGLVNFEKRRKLAEIVGEIQQYQNQPYCLQVEPSIRRFFENLDPYDGQSDKEIDNYNYDKSSEIEPKNSKKPLVKERRWPALSLKSPGIKPRSSRVPNPLPVMFGSAHKESNVSSDAAELRVSVSGAGDDTLHMTTPPTPSTPCTPPANTTLTPVTNSAASSLFTPSASIQSMSTLAASSVSLSTVCSQQARGSTLPHGVSLSSVSMAGVLGLSLTQGGTLPHSFRADRFTDQEDPVFARVDIPVAVADGQSLPYCGPVEASSAPPATPGIMGGSCSIPPPLPPRNLRRREPSLGDSSPKVQQAPDAPELPPRDASPPPIPPRTIAIHKPLTPSAASLPPHATTHFPYTLGSSSQHPLLRTTTTSTHNHPPPPIPHHRPVTSSLSHHHHHHHHHHHSSVDQSFAALSLASGISSSSSNSFTSVTSSSVLCSCSSINSSSCGGSSSSCSIGLKLGSISSSSASTTGRIFSADDSSSISSSSSSNCMNNNNVPPPLPPPLPYPHPQHLKPDQARRRNQSTDLGGAPPPPLCRRHTSNGPPHGGGESPPPPPPPRLPPHYAGPPLPPPLAPGDSSIRPSPLIQDVQPQ